MHKTKFIFILLIVLNTASYGTFVHADEPTDALVEFSQEDVLATQDELSRLDSLICATQENLARQKKLRTLIEEYRKTEKACLANPKDTNLLFKLAKNGKDVYDTIIDSYLADYFQPEFIKELQKLKQIADKKSIPPVR